MNIQTFNNININQGNFNNFQQMNMNNMQGNPNRNPQQSQAQIKSSAQTILDRIKNEFRGNSLQ